jgi:hypothetical protein
MAHWNVCIITKNDGSTIDELIEKTSAVLGKFGYEIDSAPNKRYAEQYQIDGLKEHYKTDDPAKLLKLAENLYWQECFADENGIYYMSDTIENPDGHFDSAQILGRVLPEDFGLAFLGEGGNRMCRAIITMDGEWIDGPWNFGPIPEIVHFGLSREERIKESDEWIAKLTSALKQNEHEAIFIADCHT